MQKYESNPEDATLHIENSRTSTQWYLNFSLTTDTWEMEDLCRLRVSSWAPQPLLEPYTRQWCQTPRRWTCPTCLQEQPSGCVTWGIHSAQKINHTSYDQLISDPSTYVKKGTQRSDDSILLRHMDAVVGTGPDEHLLKFVERMKTNLYLTDAVVMPNGKVTIFFFLVLGSPRSRRVEVKKQDKTR